ncbi:hypothetical protein [Polymorphospora rubra]|uniref:Uncharacterized protein n=1 Tax=Polymorphospora rubra TaxID=338584 RepID=A0A810N4X8_9ACTN|nr:hypothetical protein [Polymorphospora rubra]BCJ68357.1 hypothetical protein Prubr_53780 [Polymorphospora rubra]
MDHREEAEDHVMLTTHLLAASTVGAGTPTTDRVIATVAAVVALVGAITGAWPWPARPAARGAEAEDRCSP